MMHIKMFENFGNENDFVSLCDRLIGDSEIWKRNGDKVKALNPGFELRQINTPGIEASFDSYESRPNNIVIEVGPGNVDDSTMTHELIHALQFMERGELEIFTQDATREFSELSDDEVWEYFMLAIYMSDELEAEAQKAELKFGLQKTQKEVIDWIKMNTPEKVAKQISELTPIDNEFDLESFDEFPDLWVSVYLNYTETVVDKHLEELKDKSMLEFIAYYYLKFSAFVRYMES
jgi:hypothetical protein